MIQKIIFISEGDSEKINILWLSCKKESSCSKIRESNTLSFNFYYCYIVYIYNILEMEGAKIIGKYETQCANSTV